MVFLKILKNAERRFTNIYLDKERLYDTFDWNDSQKRRKISA